MDEWDDCSPTLSIVNSLELSSDRRNILPHKSHGRRGKAGQRGWGMAFQLKPAFGQLFHASFAIGQQLCRIQLKWKCIQVMVKGEVIFPIRGLTLENPLNQF